LKSTILAVMLGAALASPAVFAQNVHRRQVNQQRRIGEGVKSGQLTPRETVRLERNETRLNREIRRDRRDGGGLSARERGKIDRRQDALSRQIYRQKHDNQHK
jgi:hypothetical protein